MWHQKAETFWYSCQVTEKLKLAGCFPLNDKKKKKNKEFSLREEFVYLCPFRMLFLPYSCTDLFVPREGTRSALATCLNLVLCHNFFQNCCFFTESPPHLCIADFFSALLSVLQDCNLPCLFCCDLTTVMMMNAPAWPYNTDRSCIST